MQSSPTAPNISPTTSKMFTDFSIKTLIGGDEDTTSTTASTTNNNSQQLDHNIDDPIIDISQIKNESTIEQDKNSTSASGVNLSACGRTSTSQSQRTRPKNFQCPACKLAFSNNGQLKSHVRIHTGERPFRCECNKTFTRNEELTRHKLIHTGFRPHECDTCGKRFGRKDHLKKHVRTHEKNKISIKDELTVNQVDSMPESFNIRSSPATETTVIVDHQQNPVQQLVNNYWSQWYNLIGFCQQQQQQQQQQQHQPPFS